MPTHEFTFEVTTQMTLEFTNGASSSTLKQADLHFKPLKPLDKSVYIDGKGLPRKEALKPITNTLLSGLIVHIRTCAANGWMKEGEHMDYIMKHLQSMFVAVGEGPTNGYLKKG